MTPSIALRGRKRARGATMVEYALLIIAIMFLAAFSYRRLGASALNNARQSGQQLDTR
jgi:Flp pilus assembly pilin Flp